MLADLQIASRNDRLIAGMTSLLVKHCNAVIRKRMLCLGPVIEAASQLPCGNVLQRHIAEGTTAGVIGQTPQTASQQRLLQQRQVNLRLLLKTVGCMVAKCHPLYTTTRRDSCYPPNMQVISPRMAKVRTVNRPQYCAASSGSPLQARCLSEISGQAQCQVST